MKVLSLFSGGGLGDYGLELAAMEIVGQVEIDDYCQKILKLRWPDVPKWQDIRNVSGKEILETCGAIDVVSGGFPCQPFSVAGKRRGKEDDRYLWPEMFRVISEVKSAWVLGENVLGIIRFALDTVLSDLEAIGYTCQAFTLPACAFDAPHRRERVWIVAYSNGRWKLQQERCVKEQWRRSSNSGQDVAHSISDRFQANNGRESLSDKNQINTPPETRRTQQQSRIRSTGQDVADPSSKRPYYKKNIKELEREGCGEFLSIESKYSKDISDLIQPGLQGRLQCQECTGELSAWACCPAHEDEWLARSGIRRVSHGVPHRVDRLKLLGNGQVVQVVQWIGEKIMEFQKESGFLRYERSGE